MLPAAAYVGAARVYQYNHTAADVLHGPSDGYRYTAHVGVTCYQPVATAHAAGARRVV